MVRLYLPLALVAASLALTGCDHMNPQKKKEEELAKSTFACLLNGERFVVRFVDDEARILLPGAQRVTLYRIPTGTTGAVVRFSNGSMELRGRGTELTFFVDAVSAPLVDCQPYAVLPQKGT
jgi:hypothetical protein